MAKSAVTFKVTPTAGLKADVAGMLRDVSHQSAIAALNAAGLVVASEWRRAIYDYPLVDTGTYGRSIGVEVTVRDGEHALAIIGTDIVDPPYPFFLEYGTSKMGAKVHARPAVERAEPEAQRALDSTLSAMIARYG